MSLLSLNNVTKRFAEVEAVSGVTFSVDRGQVVGFLGPNGAGKSTTMRMIVQAFEPDEGELQLDGVPLQDAQVEAKRRIGYLPENNPLYVDMLVSEYLEFMARLRDLTGAAARSAIATAVDATATESVFNRPIGQLSKGFRQRVGLAQAILHRPDLLILDEPTEGLDPNQRVEIRKLINDLGKEHTVILSTHVLSEVQHTCTRLLIINAGKIVADGAVSDLMARAEGLVRVRVEVAGEGVEDALGSLDGVQRVDRLPMSANRMAVTLTVESRRDVRPDVFELAKSKAWTLYELHQEAGSLEDLFRRLTTEVSMESSPAAETQAEQ